MSLIKPDALLPSPGSLRTSGDGQKLPLTSILKLPRQRRSREMVHAILDAAILVIEGEGPDAFTTNRVAEVAGISVGSLYQYFANKEMLLAGAVERGILDSEALVREAFEQRAMDDPRALLLSTIDALAEGLSPYRRLLQHVFSVTPIAGTAGVIPMLEARLGEVLRMWVQRRHHPQGEAPLTPAMQATASGAVLLIVRWLTELQDDIPQAVFTEALTGMMLAGLAPDLRDR